MTSDIRPASASDRPELIRFLSRAALYHRHLDWRLPYEWLGTQPFILHEKDAAIVSALAMPADPPEIAWLRLLAVSDPSTLSHAWNRLFPEACRLYPALPPEGIAAVAVNVWLEKLLRESRFHRIYDIVVLAFQGSVPVQKTSLPGLIIRPMMAEDLPGVALVDQAAFEPIWRNSLDTIQRAFGQSAISSVAEYQGEIIGFQISTASAASAHLARLAVKPAFWHQHIGYDVIRDLLLTLHAIGIRTLTVNTQGNNLASKTLYTSIGFEYTGDQYPVYLYQF